MCFRLTIVFICLCFFSVFTFSGYAQDNHVIDSLESLLKKNSEDSTEIDLLNQLSDALFSSDIKKAEDLVDKAYSLAQNLNDTSRILLCISNKSHILNFNGHAGDAFQLYEQGIKLAEQFGDVKHLPTMYQQIGWIYELRADYLPALESFEKQLKIGHSQNNKDIISTAHNNIGIIYEEMGQYDDAIKHFKNSLEIARELKDNRGISNALNNMGLVYDYKGENNHAFKYYNESLILERKAGNKEGIMNGTINIGTLHQKLGDYTKAIEKFNEALAIAKEINHEYGMAICMNNIGEVHHLQGNYDKALDYFKESLRLDKKRGDKDDIAISLMNIGDVNINLGNYNKALDYLNQAYEISREIGDQSNVAKSLTSIGLLFVKQQQYRAALHKFQESLDIHMKLGEEDQVSYDLIKIGEIYYRLKKYSDAELQVLKGLRIAQRFGTKEDIKDASKLLSDIYSKTGKYKNAYENHVLYKQMYDSIFTMESKNKLSAIESKYELERKEQEIERQNETIEQQRTQQLILMLSFIAVLFAVVVAIVAYFRIRKSKNIIDYQRREILESNEELRQINEELRATIETVNSQKEEIETQRDRIEGANEELTASIRYAKYIQTAILPHGRIRDKLLQNHFVLLLPKNIVSGDFYWITEINNKTIVAVADSTGHGVPGAFMSMLGMSFLNDVINKERVQEPGQILFRLREEVVKALHQKGTPGEARDGMDVALCSIDYNSMKLQFAGANNPLYVVRKQDLPPVSGADSSSFNDKILYEIKGNKTTIAYSNTMEPFDNVDVELLEGDSVYMFSDGFADQFGGKSGKRYKYEKFKELLVKNCDLDLEIQRQMLENEFVKWKESYEQIDDVLVMGIKMMA